MRSSLRRDSSFRPETVRSVSTVAMDSSRIMVTATRTRAEPRRACGWFMGCPSVGAGGDGGLAAGRLHGDRGGQAAVDPAGEQELVLEQLVAGVLALHPA